MTEVASAYVTLMPSARGFGRSLNSQIGGDIDGSGRLAGQRFGNSMRSSVSGQARRIFAPLVAGFAGLQVGRFLSGAVEAASDLEESTNKVSEIFGDADKAIFKFGRRAAKTLGQTNVQARDAAATFGIFGKAAGLTGSDLSDFSTDFVTLASDLASFNNTSPEQAIEAIGAALRGESEPIRQYGVLLDDATLKARALKLGIIETTTQALTPQQRVLAAQAEILKQTSTAQGDFERTSGGLANQQRILSARFEDAKAKLGKALLPAVTSVVGYLNREGIPAFERFAGFVADKVIPAAQNLADDFKPFVKELLPAIGDGLGAAETVLGKVVPLAKDLVGAFNSLPDGLKQAVLIGAGATAVGLKAKSALSGAGGLASLASKARPLPVFVVNNTPGTTAPPGGGKGKFGLLAGLASAFAFTQPNVIEREPVTDFKGLDFDTAKKISAVASEMRNLANVTGGINGEAVAELDASIAKLARSQPGYAINQFRTAAFNAGVTVDELSSALPRTAARFQKLGIDVSEADKKSGFFDTQLGILNGTLDETGKKKPKPTVTLDDKASKPIGSVQGLLGAVDRTRAEATVTADISQALAAVERVRQAFNAVSIFGNTISNAADKAAQDAKDRARDQSLERAVGRGAENGTKQGLNDRSRGLTSGRR